MVTACIIQARLGSTRLPAKVLLPLPTGRTVLEEVLHRCKQIPGVDVVVAAIPESETPKRPPGLTADEWRKLKGLYAKAPEILAERASHAGAEVVRGPEHDVLARYVKAAEAVDADVVMRVTADCPLIHPRVCEQVLAAHRKHGGYVSNTQPRTWPQGFDCEVFDRALLQRAHENATSPHSREHVTPFMIAEPICRGPNVTSSTEDRSHVRLTLDTLEDYVRIWHVCEKQMEEAA